MNYIPKAKWLDLYHDLNNDAEKVEEDIRRRVGNGQIFSCFFIKRTNKAPRKMVSRLGVKYKTSGKAPKRNWDPKDHRLLQVFDMQKGAFRFINLPKVLWVKADGDFIAYHKDYFPN